MKISWVMMLPALGAAIVSGAAASGAAAHVLSAGAGRAAIAITPDLLPMQEFSSLRDPLQVRVLILNSGPARAALCVVDLTSIFEDDVAKMQALVAQAAGMAPADVLVVASHTFSAPHILPPEHMRSDASPQARQKTVTLQTLVLQAVQQAADAAVHSQRPAHLAFASGVSDVNVNRDVLTDQGWWLGANPAGPSDKTLQVVKLQDDQNHPVAVLMDYAVQSSILNESIVDGGARSISADLGGTAAAQVEAQFPGAVSIFLTGAAGDQSPTLVANRYTLDKDGKLGRQDVGEKGFVLVDLLGGRLGEDAARLAQAATADAAPARLTVVNTTVRLRQQVRPQQLAQMHPSRTYAYQVGAEVDAPVSILQIGDMAIVGVQAELSSAAGERIRRLSPFAHTVVVTMVNGAAKYMPDSDSYNRITYEATNSSYARGSAEAFEDGIVRALKALHGAGS
ncbi:MAG: hypothetical protein ACYDD1_06545 [Caulobacteraceae bacterium]